MTIQPRILLYAILLNLGFVQSSLHAQRPAQSPPRLGHVLLWGRSIDEVTSILTVKLGLQVRPGRDSGGVTNRYVRFSNGGYLELLGITQPNPEMDPGMIADQSSLHGNAGARTFGIDSSGLEKKRTELLRKGFAATPVFTSPNPNPNEKQSTKPSLPDWSLFAFERPPLSSGLFFIDYAPGYALQTSLADDRIVRTHPNGARALSSVWLLSSDANRDQLQLAKMGFNHRRAIHMSEIAAKGYCVPVDSTYVLVLEPDGPGIASDALSKSGPQVLGVSIAVTDLDRTQRWAERGYQRKIEQYDGLQGRSFLAPTQDDLGMFIEFQSITKKGVSHACGD